MTTIANLRVRWLLLMSVATKSTTKELGALHNNPSNVCYMGRIHFRKGAANQADWSRISDLQIMAEDLGVEATARRIWRSIIVDWRGPFSLILNQASTLPAIAILEARDLLHTYDSNTICVVGRDCSWNASLSISHEELRSTYPRTLIGFRPK